MPDHRNFASQVSHVQPGSPVSASNTSMSTRQLEQRTNYLREVLEGAEAGKVLVRQDQPLHVSVQAGHAVYWNAADKCFDRALAGVTSDAASNAMVPLDTADCLGICLAKTGATAGAIAMLGMLRCDAATMSVMIDGNVSPGRYYLSSQQPGKLVKQRPPVTVAVAHVLGPLDDCESDSWVFVYPQMRDFLEDHVHYQIDLYAQPAGSHVPPPEGEPHEILDPDGSQPGWLPADHASFQGAAPAGARFGYNLAQHAELRQIWPPIPITATLLELHQPHGDPDRISGYERVPDAYVRFDQYGIWWMTDCYNQVPWAADLDTTGSEPLESESSESSQICPTTQPFSLRLSFLKMTFATDKSVVTSLQSADGEAIEFVNPAGNPATAGDLVARLNLAALIAPDLVRGGTAIKGIVDERLTFERGWIAEGLIAGSEGVVLAGSHQERLDPTLPAGPGNPVLHQGIITVDIQTDPVERELTPQLVRLQDVLESEYRGVDYLGFPQGRNSNIRLRFNVPTAGLPLNPRLKIRTLIFGRATGPFSAMQMSYHRVVRPAAGTPTPITTSSTSVDYNVVTPSDDYDGNGTDLPVDNAIEIESDAFVVAAGDTVFVTVGRLAAAVPPFGAEIGLIRVAGVIVQGV